jgi:LmbE family N-acetylglucosaminyl deacetylase
VNPSTNLPTPSRALAIGAHPDDIEFGCGATLAKWAAGGGQIRHLVCTDGAKGSWDPGADLAELAVARQHEQRAASKALGGHGDVIFLGWPDGELDAGIRQRWEVAYWIRKTRPDVVLGHDPWRRYRLHPDHRNAGFLTTDGLVAARDPHFFPEQELAPHRPAALLLWEAEEPDHVEEVSGFSEAKVAALLAHHSQLRSTMHIDDPGAEGEVDRFRSRIIEQLTEHGSRADFSLGEAFKLIKDL